MDTNETWLGLTMQEIYDKAVSGLIKQGGPATNGHKCLYRTASGRKCGIGQVIPDGMYKVEMDTDYQGGSGIAGLIDQGLLPRPSQHMLEFLTKLQFCHDHADKASDVFWLIAFKDDAYDLARLYDLRPHAIWR